jgi:DNA-binding IclR family transcriptional regulator
VNGVTGSIKSAERVLDILETLADDDRRRVSLVELARRLSIPKSSLHGLLRVLATRGYVDFQAASRTYSLGARVLSVAGSYLASFDLPEAAKPIMAALARVSGETITLDVPHGPAMITIAREPGRQPIRVITRLGLPFAAHATASGKLMLSFLPAVTLEQYYPKPELPTYTPTTVPTVEALAQELGRIRERGVAYAHSEINEGVEAIAVPIADHEQRVVAALDALLPAHRARPEHTARLERVLLAGARLTSARLGEPSSRAALMVDPEEYLEQVWQEGLHESDGSSGPPSGTERGEVALRLEPGADRQRQERGLWSMNGAVRE